MSWAEPPQQRAWACGSGTRLHLRGLCHRVSNFHQNLISSFVLRLAPAPRSPHALGPRLSRMGLTGSPGSSSRKENGWVRALTLTRRRPAGMCLRAVLRGGQQMVAPALGAAIHLLLDAADRLHLPAAVHSPVPAMNLPLVRLSLELVDDAKRGIMPALGPPMSPTPSSTVNGNSDCSAILTPITGSPDPSVGPGPAPAPGSTVSALPAGCGAHEPGQGRLAGHRVAVHGGDDVPGLEHARGGRAASACTTTSVV